MGSFLLVACQPQRERIDESLDTLAPTSANPIELQLVGRVPYADDSDEGFLYRIEVRRGTRIDTIPNVLTLLKAVAEGDSVVHGFRYDSLGTMRHGFRFSVTSRQLDTLPLPDDLLPQVSYPALSSGARHLAYVRFDTNGTARGIIRRWPTLQPVFETPPIGFVAGDMLGGAAEWEGAETFIIYIDPFNDGSNRWARFRGQLGSNRLAVDTVPLGGHPDVDEK